MNLCKQKPYCFMDFDGTVIDNKSRLYQFFIANIPERYCSVLSIDEFWQLKKMGIHEIDWVNMIYEAGIDKENWNKKKMQEIESARYLAQDRLFEFTIGSLERLKEAYYLVLITRRSRKDNLLGQINYFELTDYFEDIHVLPHDGSMKSEVISRYVLSEDDIVVGDTEDDFMSGIAAGRKTYMVLSGIRSSWVVRKYNMEKKVMIIRTIGELTV